jgi:DnaJ-class molecular chaperone
MIGHLDVEKVGQCDKCLGSGRDPKNRKQRCTKCDGDGRGYFCSTCGERMPCGGTEDVLDQAYCSRRDNEAVQS